MGRSKGSTIGVPSGTCGFGLLDSFDGGSAIATTEAAVLPVAEAREIGRSAAEERPAIASRADNRIGIVEASICGYGAAANWEIHPARLNPAGKGSRGQVWRQSRGHGQPKLAGTGETHTFALIQPLEGA